MVGAESDFGAERNFLEELPVAADGGDAKVGATEIDTDGEIGHGGRLSEVRRGGLGEKAAELGSTGQPRAAVRT